jgi:hypothetical protein
MQIIIKKEVVEMMESDCNYDKVKLLHQLSKLLWMIDKHYLADAKKANHPLCAEMYKDIAKDLQKHKQKLVMAIEGLSKEGKFR